ncbi:hypothetical protein ACK333_02755 [Aeromonas veronii]
MELKRNIDEIIAIYDLETSVKDIYVEGNRDKSFFQWIIGTGIDSRSEIYSADDICVPDEILCKYGLHHGSNRNKIIATSLAIADSLPNCNNAIFIVDKDYTSYLKENISSPLLRFTDYNSLELYSLNECVIRKLMALVYGRFTSTLPSFYYEMQQILKSLYAIRLTSIMLEWNLTWLDFDKYIKVNQSVDFNEDKYIEAYLNKNSKLGEKKCFYDELIRIKASLDSDSRMSCRGHDFTALLMYIMNKKYPRRKIENLEAFEGFLIGLIDKVDLLSEKLIGEVYKFSGYSEAI